ncbi:MAG TPA: ComF family protein [Afifellaceae bacterium]|nr:ComF family protein [Afifellaceae bacterium]
MSIATNAGTGARGRWRSLRDRCIDLLLPPVCPACRVAVGRGDALCAECWMAMPFISEPVCAVYGTPFAYRIGDGIVSAQAIADPPPFEAARAAVRYGPEAQALVHALKYQDRHEVARVMATAMVRAGEPLLARCHVIVPVPLHRWRLWRRRYNQSQILAAEISRRSGIRNDPFLLERRRKTRQQVGLSAGERQTNVRGAFRVPEQRRADLAGVRVLLVDDVYTSGATVKAASRALLRGGAEAVDVLTFANVCL